jgi:16S rRNA (guanine1207-N2)-methyltransferase
VDQTSHYFDPVPVTPSRPGRVELTLPDLRLGFTTDRGVFAADHVDPGTKLLLLEAPEPPPGPARLLDVGCGYGPIACTLARRRPEAEVWAVDVNERARALCRANADEAGCTNVRVAAPDEVPEELRFDAVYSNPPIRIGKAALHELLTRWLGRLAPGGHAYLVVHKHLGSDSLARWLEAQGLPTERLTSRAGYRILAVGAAS